ncbi:MAG: adenylyl-sulfate kinase [Oscillospiraceae bacterium]|nr:adenylyl-sulfate kinase [Oscillospiraceae bacterium]
MAEPYTAPENEELLNIVTVGHVDHGKSTVIGRLLADAGALPQGKLEAIRENCRRNSKPFEYAFLLDALHNEQDQGITIDTARCFFKSDKRRYIIIDAPGHIEFLKNMVTGASRAEAALMVIDASRGVEENTRRHGYFLSMLGITQVAVLVNKMDLADYREDVFRSIEAEFTDFLEKIHIAPAAFIPVSGMEGDNIALRSDRTPWYAGPTVLEQMDAFAPVPSPERRPFRMPVQGVYKFTGGGDERRIVAGTLEAGSLRAGARSVFWPSGTKTAVSSLEVFAAPVPEKFTAGQAAGFTMAEQIFIRRGEIACLESENAPFVGVRLRANVFWLGREPLRVGRRYYFKCGTAKVEARPETILRVVDASSLDNVDRDYVDKNEVAELILRLDRPTAFDTAESGCDATRRFVLVDGYEIAGGGIVTQALAAEDYDQRNLRWSAGAMTGEERRAATGRRGLVVWLTGLSGSGKTTIAQETERRLIERGVAAYLLDGDKLRRGLCGDLGFSDEDRAENIRRAAETAGLFADAGLVTLCTFISPFAAGRRKAREIAGEDFLEVWVRASLETCMARDPKKLYQKALDGKIHSFTGIDSPYEEPAAPELILDTETRSEAECVDLLTETILRFLEGDAAL